MYKFLRIAALAVLIVSAPTFMIFSTLSDYARNRGSVELRDMTSAQLERAEWVVNTSIERLRSLANADLTTCSRNHRRVFREAARTSPFVHGVGMVDSNGNIMCMEPDRAGYPRQVMLPTRLSDPVTTYHVAEMAAGRGRSLLTAWRIENGMRVVVATTPEAVHIDAGPGWMREGRDIRVTINENDLWFSRGRILSDDLTSRSEVDLLVHEARSERFPMDVRARVPVSLVMAQTSELHGFFALSAGVVGLFFFSLMVWHRFKSGEDLDEAINKAIKRKEFVAYYQPVMNLETGQLAGCEALMRWRKRDGSIVPPGQFLPYAETSGHIHAMTRQIMRRVQSDLGDLYRDRPDLKVSVNLVAAHFDNRKIVDDVTKLYSNGGVSFEHLVLEVTERLPLRDIERAKGVIAELQSLGVRIALDDAGTGHGGLAYIQKLGTDIVKIDKMFIDSISSDKGASSIVDLLVELAANLEMGVIAEGVETLEQVEVLREMGVTYAQGYIFAPPLPPDQFLALANALTGKASQSRRAKTEAKQEAPEDDMPEEAAEDQEDVAA